MKNYNNKVWQTVKKPKFFPEIRSTFMSSIKMIFCDKVFPPLSHSRSCKH